MSAVASLTVYNCIYVPPTTPRNQLDGDTFRCQGNVAPIIPDAQTWIPKVRVIKINAPETGAPKADDARTALIDWLTRRPFNLICFGRDKYGRLLADAESGEGLLSDYMITKKLAIPMSLLMARSLAPGLDEPTLRAIVHPTMISRPEVTP